MTHQTLLAKATRRFLPPVLIGCLAATGALAVDSTAATGGWTLEKGVAEPSYAVADTTRTNLNVETVVLACEGTDAKSFLQLQLYMSDEGALQPTYIHTAAMKDDPRAVVSIDGKDFPVSLLFADDHVVLADAQDGPWPMVSPALLNALESGKTMTVKVDLLAEPNGPAAMDGEAVVNLQGPGGHNAVAALRHCADSASPNVAEVRAPR
jgi:hypothetical protein